jgi:hypothetical protein
MPATARKPLQVKRAAPAQEAPFEPETMAAEPAVGHEEETPSYAPYIVMGILAIIVFGVAILLQVAELNSYHEPPSAFPTFTPRAAPVEPVKEEASGPETKPQPAKSAVTEEAAEPESDESP